MGTIKIAKKRKKLMQVISGIGFILIGSYMLFIQKDIRGQIPIIVGVGVLLYKL